MHRVGFVFLCLVLFWSCDSNRIYDTYKSIDSNGWAKQNSISFEFEISDTLSTNNLFVNIRNTDDYLYNNLFVITELEFPSGLSVIDTLEYEMADFRGKWLGTGFTDVKESSLFYRENFVFSESGKYNFKIQQAMRKRSEVTGIEYLKGISNVGFRIESTTEK
jgi:gliding motility-associated lipoprotein GldH